MTTAPRTTRTGRGPGVAGRAVLVAALVVTAGGGLLASVGALAEGRPAALGVLVGTLLVLAFFGLGALVLDLVAGLAPALSLLVALLTYTLQVVLLGLVLVGLSRSGLLESALDRRWLGAAVIAGTLGWTLAQLAVTARARQPLYDLAEGPRTNGCGARSGAKEAAAW